MADFYAQMAAVASRLLTDKGQSVTFTRETVGNYDPGTGEETTTSSTFTGYGAAFDYNQSEIDGEVIKSSDIRFVMEATATAPEIGDTVPVSGDTYRVQAVKPTSPAGTVVIYEVQLRL